MSIQVKIWGYSVGYLEWDKAKSSAVFKYDKSFFTKNLSISPIFLPLNSTIYQFDDLPSNTFKGLPGVFADSLPDKFGEGLMNIYFESSNKRFADLTPLDRLAYVGSRGMGALEYVPAAQVQTSNEVLQIEQLEGLAKLGIDSANNLFTQKNQTEPKDFKTYYP